MADEECTPDGEDPFAGCTAVKLYTQHLHACGYHVAYAAQEMISNPGGPLRLLEEGGAVFARKTIMRMAERLWRDDPQHFLAIAGCSLRSYLKKQRKPPNTGNWFGYFEAFLFMREYKSLDLRFIGNSEDGSYFATDNKNGSRKNVAFMMFDKRGKIDLGAIRLKDGKDQIIFT